MLFDAAHGAISAAFAAAKPGAKGFEVDAAARSHLTSRGLPEITHATGHQVGRYEHDGGAMLAPQWKRYGNAPFGTLEKNMIFTLEPTILLEEGDFSVLCEEDILITESGAEFLSSRQTELVLVPCTNTKGGQ